MPHFLPKTFRFSMRISLICLVLSFVMLRAATWQWSRYLYKVQLGEAYRTHAQSPALHLPLEGVSATDFQPVLHRKVHVTGSYDFEHQMIVLNRRHVTGPGYWLLTPMKIQGSEKYVIVSRGFIPFQDATAESWQKYNFSSQEEFDAIVQPTIASRTFFEGSTFGVKNKQETSDSGFQQKWLYPDVEKIAKQLPYPVITSVFLQHFGTPPIGMFPAESVSIDVPASTHYGYTIEWIFLAIATIVIGFLLQAYPRKYRLPK